jgi:cell division protein FtsL
METTFNEPTVLDQMERLESLAHSYSQAPWRRQLQIIGVFLLCLVAVAVVSGIYLSVSSKATEVGRDIQDKQKQIVNYDREIEDRESRLALILSTEEMEARARRLGFQPIQSDQVVYMNIPGYVKQRPVVLAPSTPRSLAEAPVMPAHYKESLFAWMKRKLSENSLVLSGVMP